MRQGWVDLISRVNLDRLGVLYDPSDELVRWSDGSVARMPDEKGVRFAWPGHYLVYGMVPAACIVNFWTFERFERVCAESGKIERLESDLFVHRPNWPLGHKREHEFGVSDVRRVPNLKVEFEFIEDPS